MDTKPKIIFDQGDKPRMAGILKSAIQERHSLVEKLNRPELKEKINFHKIISYFKEHYDIVLTYDQIYSMVYIATQEDYEGSFGRNGAHFDPNTGDIAAAFVEPIEITESLIVHELTHSFTGVVTTVNHEKTSNSSMQLYVDNESSLITSGPSGERTGTFLSEMLALDIQIEYLIKSHSYTYDQAWELIMQYSQQYYFYAAFKQLLRTITTSLENGDVKNEFILLCKQADVDFEASNSILRLLIKAQQSSLVEQKFRELVNRICQPLPDFYDQLLLVANNYYNKSSGPQKDNTNAMNVEYLLRIIEDSYDNPSSKIAGVPGVIRAWEELTGTKLDVSEKDL